MADKITKQENGTLNVPNQPVIPFIIGDGIGAGYMECQRSCI